MRRQARWRRFIILNGLPHIFGRSRRRHRPVADRSHGSRLCAVLPLTEESRFCGLPARVLRGASNVHSCRFDLVTCKERAAAAIGACGASLKEMNDWDVLEIKDVPAGGAAEQLLALAAADHYLVGQWPTDVTPYVSLRGAAEALQVIPSGEFRRNLRRHMRRASEKWQRRVASRGLGRLRRASAILCTRDERLERPARTAIASRPATQLFYDEIAKSASTLGYFSLYLLHFDGVPVAGHFGLTYQDRYYAPRSLTTSNTPLSVLGSCWWRRFCAIAFPAASANTIPSGRARPGS